MGNFVERSVGGGGCAFVRATIRILHPLSFSFCPEYAKSKVQLFHPLFAQLFARITELISICAGDLCEGFAVSFTRMLNFPKKKGNGMEKVE